MPNSPHSESQILSVALVAAFPGYVDARLQELGVVNYAQLDEVIGAATTALGESLHALFETDSRQQLESPLEVVRLATGSVTAELESQGVEYRTRDQHAIEIHPDDPYGLYPASSRDLGEEVWRLHMQWGIEKARLVAGMVPAAVDESEPAASGVPSVALFGVGAGYRDDFRSAIAGRGYHTLIWRNPAALTDGIASPPELVVVDLDHPRADQAIQSLVVAGIRVVAVGGRVDDFSTTAMMALGAEEVVELDRLVDRLSGLLPRLA
ncbi:MAG: hypothetical protein U9N84_00655 [Actinomycetota bacterium]|nr:hypothetical protein [Actinomycetota bacterium]